LLQLPIKYKIVHGKSLYKKFFIIIIPRFDTILFLLKTEIRYNGFKIIKTYQLFYQQT